MSLETTHIIKKADVAASRATQPDPSVLQGSLKISGKRVEMTYEPVDAEPPLRRNRRVRGENAVLDRESFEIYTREMERTRATRIENEKHSPDDEELSSEELEAQWEARLEEEVAKAREDGFQAGKASIRSEMEQAVREAASDFARDLGVLQQAWEKHLSDSRVLLVQLAFRIAAVVLDAPLPGDIRRISEAAITDAIEGMVDGVPLDVAVHPVSFLRLQEAGLEEQLRAVHGKLRWRSDPTLKENEWMVQSDRSATRRLEAELLDDLQRELALRDHSSDTSEADRSNAADSQRSDPDDAKPL